MQTISGGDAVHKTLKAAGVDCVFGIPSQQNLALYDALCRHGDIRVVGTRHEQGAVHAADGYARASGRLGVAIVSTGPGTANAMNGLYEAAFASSPVLLLTTQIDTIHLGKGRGFIHDAEGQGAMLASVVRAHQRVRQARDIPRILQHVITDIRSARPQPGAVEIPTDLLAADIAEDALSFAGPGLEPQTPDDTALDHAAQRLGEARRPLLWVGGGAVDATAEIQTLAEILQAPVVSTLNGRGVMPPDHPLYLGTQTHLPAFNPLLAEADLVLAIGTRFQALASQYWQQPMPRALIHLDADPGVIGRNYPVEIALVGDAAAGAQGLLERVNAKPVDAPFHASAHAVRDRLQETVREMIGPDHQRIVESIHRHLPADSPWVGDATITANTWGSHLLAAHAPRLAHYCTSLAIGPALPLALGAAVATGRKTLALHGDGGVMLNIAEIATAVEAQVPLVLCVFNDRGYGVLKGLQHLTTGREYGVDLHTPDFVALAGAMGMPGERVCSCDEFDRALQSALQTPGPYLLEVDLEQLAPIRMFG